ncbi:MAG: hypothetical protein A2270_08495 [Elusimicrobia bacterium RIFOXYA12_FULL_51_18]|nr:MAG: hypothetical protein A2270_08495 [Elusimicrobia bacterium RIFOXYA12_FULL_51_18]OGS28663.1 MAG: hypothetical protein A2218_09810 [Elusimicrobia bacterium RIFOXYA2_FULL_53_38]
MKIVVISAVLGLFGVFAGAQENTQAVPEKPVVEAPDAPAQPIVQAAPVQTAAVVTTPLTMAELKKSHGQALAELKKKREEAIKQLKESMKGKPVTEMREAISKQRAVDKTAVKALKDFQNAEIEHFKKDHPEAVKKIKEIKKQENNTPVVPEKK